MGWSGRERRVPWTLANTDGHLNAAHRLPAIIKESELEGILCRHGLEALPTDKVKHSAC